VERVVFGLLSIAFVLVGNCSIKHNPITTTKKKEKNDTNVHSRNTQDLTMDILDLKTMRAQMNVRKCLENSIKITFDWIYYLKGMNWTLKDFNQFQPLKIVFAIWKTLMNLGIKDIEYCREINWFKARMNQFVILTDISTQQILNHTEL